MAATRVRRAPRDWRRAIRSDTRIAPAQTQTNRPDGVTASPGATCTRGPRTASTIDRDVQSRDDAVADQVADDSPVATVEVRELLVEVVDAEHHPDRVVDVLGRVGRRELGRARSGRSCSWRLLGVWLTGCDRRGSSCRGSRDRAPPARAARGRGCRWRAACRIRAAPSPMRNAAQKNLTSNTVCAGFCTSTIRLARSRS